MVDSRRLLLNDASEIKTVAQDAPHDETGGGEGLIVPLGADDVIVENAGTLVEAAKAGEKVGVVHGEFSRGAHGEIDLRVAGVCEDRRTERGVEVGIGAPANLAVQGDLLEETRLEEESVMTVSVIAVIRKNAEVRRAQALVAEIAEEADKVLALE